MNGERVYIEGDIWEDRDGDEWEVREGGHLHLVKENGDYGPPFKTENVERNWGPLALKKPAPDGAELPMADWEQALLERGWDGPIVDEAQWMDASDLDSVLMLKVSPGILNKLDPKFVEHAVGVYKEALKLLLKKGADYGPKSISEAPGGPLNGLRVRMWDKTARINNLIDSGAEPENESLRDSFGDLLNYSAIALMVLDGNWPGVDKS